jgi:ankyrin repeat protein
MTAWLLDHGADPNRQCDLDLTPTSCAVYQAPLQLVDYVFSRGADVCHGQLLHHAVLRDDCAVEMVRRIVEKGAPVNKTKYEDDPNSYAQRWPFGLGTPLHRAAELGNREVVEYLLSVGADPLKLDSRKCTPRYWARERRHVEVAELLNNAEQRMGALSTDGTNG